MTWRLRFGVQSAGAEDEFENLFSEKEEEVVSTMTSEEYIKAMQYRALAAVDKSRALANPTRYVFRVCSFVG